MLKLLSVTILNIVLAISCYASRISGTVSNDKGEILPFSTISVKGKNITTAANARGYYFIDLSPGKYVLICRHVGYEKKEVELFVEAESLTINFSLAEQKAELKEVVVKAGAEDPAYEIIRKAIRKRKTYLEDQRAYECEVYSKGVMNLRDFPNKILGEKVDFEDGDTSKKKMIYLAETVSRLSVEGKGKKRIEVLSTKVSGQRDGFGFAGAGWFSFYENNVMISQALNPRGFVSPIAENALSMYRYKYEGTFFEDSRQIHIIRVTVKFFGFDAYGSFTNVYSQFNTEPVFAKNHFKEVFLKYVKGSNKKSLAYWDSIRPLALAEEEVRDYLKKDSLERKREDPVYLDSLDKVRNKIKWQDVLLSGKTFSRQNKKMSFTLKPLIRTISFNPGEGVVFDMPFEFEKKITDRKRYEIIPNIRYGLSSDQLYYWGTFRWYGGERYRQSFTFSAGIKPLQFNNDNPVDPFVNSISSLRNEDNFLKMYAANFVKTTFSKGIGNGLTINGGIEYQDRIPFDNTSDASWNKTNDKFYSPNYPTELLTEQFKRHEALVIQAGFSWRPKSRYIEFPDRVINIGSKWPLLTFQYTKGIQGLVGSNVDYDNWQTAMEDDLNARLLGTFKWKIKNGGFLNARQVEVQDLNHFAGNRFSFPTDYMDAFQLPEYYGLSNRSSFYSALFAEHHFNGFLTNKME